MQRSAATGSTAPASANIAGPPYGTMNVLSEDLASQAGGALQLPLDFYRTPNTTTHLASYVFAFDLPSQELTALSLDALVGGAFVALLARYNGQSSIPLTASRAAMAGDMLGVSFLRVATPPGATLRQLAVAIRDDHCGGSTGATTSNDHRRGMAGATASREPSAAAITWLTGELGTAAHDPLAVVRRLPAESRDADLHLVVSCGGGRCHAAFVYNTSLFRHASIERFAGHLCVLLDGAATRLDAAITSLPLLTAAERAWITSVCNGPTKPLPETLLHEVVEQHAARAPAAVAVRFRDDEITYFELNARANRLARYLGSRGVGAGSHVAVCVEPAFDIAIALLAILKIGAVYVPLDPGYPPARIAAIVSDTGPAIILSRRSLIERLALGALPTLALDEASDALAALDDGNLGTAIEPSWAAYIYFTSGTTGNPKGVVASHANLTSYIQVAQVRYAFSSRDVMPAIARFSFSISMFELMSPLVAGGTLLILEREHVLDLARMARTLSEVTFFHAGPSLLKNVIAHIRRNYADFSAFSRVRHASSGGDMVAPEVLEALKEIFSEAEVFVIYGCSEISCMGCTYPAPRDRVVDRTYVGRPFANMNVRVLDPAQNIVPVGVVGEIHFAGGGVVGGYLNRAELTAEKFVEIEGQRFYRMGDMGRLSDEGWVEILGRTDFQVKLRGMRVELGEVEHNVRRAPGVRDGVVMAKSVGDGEKRLIAYVVTEGESANDERTRASRMAAIRRYMTERLPDYMVPSAYVELTSLPLNHNMKVDRYALPGPPLPDSRQADSLGLRSPETQSEKRLAALWEKLLDIETVALDDNFFDLGGHSILAMELIVAVEREMGVVLDGMDVLRESLEVLAAICDRQLGNVARASRVRSRSTRSAEKISPFHFGKSKELYGVLHDVDTVPAQAVLICAPIGFEHVRTQFVLRQLAKRLAAGGTPVLRFDYFGCGDSLGDDVEATCERWQQDIAEAYKAVMAKTHAPCVTAVGVRLGATLVWNARSDLEKLVLWDPIVSGAAYYAEMSETHRRYLRSVRHLRLRTRSKRASGVELLGSTYSDQAICELKALTMRPRDASDRPSVGWLATSQPARQEAYFRALVGDDPASRIESLDVDCHWDDIAQMEDILPDIGVTKMLAAMIEGAE